MQPVKQFEHPKK